MSGTSVLVHRAIGGHVLGYGDMAFVRNAGHEELADDRRKYNEPHGDQAKPCGQVFAVLELHVVEQKNIADVEFNSLSDSWSDAKQELQSFSTGGSRPADRKP